MYAVHEHQNNSSSKLENPEQQHADYDDFETRDEDDENMSDASSMLDRPRPRKQKLRTPIVPQKSELRASRILENLTLELQSLQQAAIEDLQDRHASTLSDPHELYLSSEEDASESADDYDESFVELDAENDLELQATSSHTSSRSSREDTARAVSFMYVGKPHLVDIFTHERPQTSSLPKHRPAPLRLNSIPTYPSRPSTSSSRSFTMTAATASNFTTRQKRNAISALSTLSTNIKTRAASASNFLASDPFPGNSKQHDFYTSAEEHDSPYASAPKTPSSIANAAWKGGVKGFNRTLTLSKRRPSMPKLSLAYASGNKSVANIPTPPALPLASDQHHVPSYPAPFRASTDLASKRLSLNLSTMERDYSWMSKDFGNGGLAQVQEREQVVSPGPVRYEDIMRNVIRSPPLPATTAHSHSFSSASLLSSSRDKDKELKGRPSVLGLGIRRLGRVGAN